MLLAASRRKVAPVPVVSTSAATVMSPSCVPSLPVVMLTLVPASRRLVMSELRTTLSSWLGVKTLGSTAEKSPVVGPVPSMVMLRGSSSQVPARPLLAAASMPEPSTERWFLPEVSIRPPSPPCAPPRAEMLAKVRVVSSLQRMTVPPSPRWVASARMVVPELATVIWELPWSAIWRPWKSPPMRTRPPPSAPETSSVVLNRAMRWPVTSIVPPLTSWALRSRGVRACGRMRPSRTTRRPPPRTSLSLASICPPTTTSPVPWPCSSTFLPLTVPVVLMARPKTSPAAMITLPPPRGLEVSIVPVLVTAAVVASPRAVPLTRTCIAPSR